MKCTFMSALATLVVATASLPAHAQDDTEPADADVPDGAADPNLTEPEPLPPVAPAPQTATVDASMLGGAGESCRARSDCQAGLRCIDAVCRDEREGTSCQSSMECGSLKCIQNRCTSSTASLASTDPKEEESHGWMDFTFGEGTHGFTGISMLGGPGALLDIDPAEVEGVEPAWAFELYGGVLINRFELALHFSPVAYKLYDANPDTQLSARLTVGGYIPITESVSWVMRAGAGFAAVNTGLERDDVLPMLQADLIGVAIHVGHLNIEIDAPSYRVAIAA
jgi:hypothetical protein